MFPSLPGEECFRAKRGASVCGLRVLSTQPEQRSYTTRGQNREKGRKPEVGLPLWDERGFSLLNTQPVVRALVSWMSKLQTGRMTSLRKRMATLPWTRECVQ